MKVLNYLVIGSGIVLLAKAEEAPRASEMSIQRAVDQNPGRMVFVPAGDHPISSAIRITTNNAGLWGPGRIIQQNPEAAIVEVAGASGVQIRDVTLTRPEGRRETHSSGLSVTNSPDIVIANVRVVDNWADRAAILAADSPRVQIRDCTVRNYSRVSIDDRTATSFLGYAFNCIESTGISVRDAQGALIANNRVIENRLLPTEEVQRKYELGKIVKKNAERGWHISEQAWNSNFFRGWHQGSGIFVGASESSDCIQIVGNYIENAAQGTDIHADHVIYANNVVTNSFIGMKAIHGSRNVIISGNQFAKNDLWSIGVKQGTSSHVAGVANDLGGGKRSRLEANIDVHSIVANNIVSDFGYGREHWNWPVESSGNSPFQFGAAINGRPPIRDVLVLGNIVHDPGHDGVLADGVPRVEPPRYQHAVRITTGEHAPINIWFADNLIDPGTQGLSNISLSGGASAASR